MFVCDKAPDMAGVLKAEIIETPLVYIVLPCYERFIYKKKTNRSGWTNNKIFSHKLAQPLEVPHLSLVPSEL